MTRLLVEKGAALIRSKDLDEQSFENGRDGEADWCRPIWNPVEGQAGQGALCILVGLDMGPPESARIEARRKVLGIAVVLLLIGSAGMVSLFLAHKKLKKYGVM